MKEVYYTTITKITVGKSWDYLCNFFLYIIFIHGFDKMNKYMDTTYSNCSDASHLSALSLIISSILFHGISMIIIVITVGL